MLEYSNRAPFPYDDYPFDDENIPSHQRGVFHQLKEAAILGGELYYEQKKALLPYLNVLDEVADSDPLAKNPFTVPNERGRFVHFDEHEKIAPLLRQVRSKIFNIAASAERVDMQQLSTYLYILASNLPMIGYGEGVNEVGYHMAMKAYGRLRNSTLNFHFLPVETEDGKQMWQGYLGVQDKDSTREVATDIRSIREAGVRRYGGWFSLYTEMRVDNVVVMAGFLADPRERGVNFSAMNIPNETELVTEVGTKIIVCDASFNRIFNEMVLERSRLYLATLPDTQGTVRYVGAHEITHDERYDNYLGRLLHNPTRESYANNGGIDLAADVWSPDNDQTRDSFETIYRGYLGYVFRDCFDVLRMPEVPNLEQLAQKSRYIPGELAGLHQAIEEKALKVKNGIITEIDLIKARGLARRLALQERAILRNGTEEDARNYFESILPREPIFNSHNVLV